MTGDGAVPIGRIAATVTFAVKEKVETRRVGVVSGSRGGVDSPANFVEPATVETALVLPTFFSPRGHPEQRSQGSAVYGGEGAQDGHSAPPRGEIDSRPASAILTLSRQSGELTQLKTDMGALGAAMIFPLAEALEQMVDEGLIPAKTRNEIWGRVRKEVRTANLVSERVSWGMSSAIPHYPTQEDLQDRAARERRMRKEILSLRPGKDDADPTDD